MNKLVLHNFSLLLLYLFMNISVSAQNGDTTGFKLPVVELKTMDGKKFSSSEICKEGKPVVIIIWKSCCTPNIKMLDDINEVYSDWKKETGVIIYAVSIDDSRNAPKVAPLANAKEWEFTVLLDPNSDFKRLMNVNATPHVFILNKKGEVIWQKTTYNPGEEIEIFNVIKQQ